MLHCAMRVMRVREGGPNTTGTVILIFLSISNSSGWMHRMRRDETLFLHCLVQHCVSFAGSEMDYPDRNEGGVM